MASYLFFRLCVLTDRHIEDCGGLVCVESSSEGASLGSAEELSEQVKGVRHYGSCDLQTAQILVACPHLCLHVYTACLWTEVRINTTV